MVGIFVFLHSQSVPAIFTSQLCSAVSAAHGKNVTGVMQCDTVWTLSGTRHTHPYHRFCAITSAFILAHSFQITYSGNFSCLQHASSPMETKRVLYIIQCSINTYIHTLSYTVIHCHTLSFVVILSYFVAICCHLLSFVVIHCHTFIHTYIQLHSYIHTYIDRQTDIDRHT